MSNDNVALLPQVAFRNSAKHPIRFDVCHPGSTFRIVKEPSRGIYKSNDQRVYRKAHEHEGFYAEDVVTKKACCLMPHDMVMPVVKDKGAKERITQEHGKPAPQARKVANG
jgi:hypothetical protein